MAENINLRIKEFYKLDYDVIQNGGKHCSEYLNNEFISNNIIDEVGLYSRYIFGRHGFYYTLSDHQLSTIKYLFCVDKETRLIYILKLNLKNVTTTRKTRINPTTQEEYFVNDLVIRYIDKNFYDSSYDDSDDSCEKNKKCYNDCVYKVIAY